MDGTSPGQTGAPSIAKIQIIDAVGKGSKSARYMLSSRSRRRGVMLKGIVA